MNIIYNKSKEDLYNDVMHIFYDTLISANSPYIKYENWIIGVRYKDEVFFEWDIVGTYDLENFFRNYFISHSIEDIDFIYVYDSNDIYVSKKLPIDENDILSQITYVYAKNDKYLNFMEKGDYIYDTYYKPNN